LRDLRPDLFEHNAGDVLITGRPDGAGDTTAFNGRPSDWVAGTTATLAQARRNRTNGGFTGVASTLAQYRIGSLDAGLCRTLEHCPDEAAVRLEVVALVVPCRQAVDGDITASVGSGQWPRSTPLADESELQLPESATRLSVCP